jgi:hypothetical protein
MTGRKKTEPTTDQADAIDASADVVHGMTKAEAIADGRYIPARRSRIAIADPETFPRLTPEGDDVPFWIEIDDALTFRQIEQLPEDTTWHKQMQAIAPYVYDWNAVAELDDGSGRWEPVPPPAVGGWEQLLTQTLHVTSFIFACLKYNIDLKLPKGLKPTKPMDSGGNEPDET